MLLLLSPQQIQSRKSKNTKASWKNGINSKEEFEAKKKQLLGI
jgi:hypothetical protein